VAALFIDSALTAPGYHLNRQNKLVIESKEELQKRGVAPIDDSDALALTFAAAVAPPEEQSEEEDLAGRFGNCGRSSWMA
jgi:hypothetical protein